MVSAILAAAVISPVKTDERIVAAEAAVSQLLQKLGQVDSTSSMRAVVIENPRRLPTTVSLSNESWSALYAVEEARILSLTNTKRETEIARRIGRTGGKFYVSEEEAWRKAEVFAQKVWQGPALKRVRMSAQSDLSANQVPSSNAARVRFEMFDTPPGTQLLGVNGIRIALDIQDGELLSLSMTTGWSYGPPTATFSEAEARTLAVQTMATKRSVTAEDIGSVERAYVNPTTTFGAIRDPGLPAKQLRYAFVFNFGKDAVWVDANNGRLLGGRLVR
jgi:hypothetical protein